MTYHAAVDSTGTILGVHQRNDGCDERCRPVAT